MSVTDDHVLGISQLFIHYDVRGNVGGGGDAGGGNAGGGGGGYDAAMEDVNRDMLVFMVAHGLDQAD